MHVFKDLGREADIAIREVRDRSFGSDVEVLDSDAHAITDPREEGLADGREVDEGQGDRLATVAQERGQSARRLRQPGP